MDLTGEYRIPAPRETVWAALNNPDILKACIPGCEELNKTSDTELVAKVVAKIGPVKATFGGKVTLSDLDPPNGYTISGEGQGGAAGFAKGGSEGAVGAGRRGNSYRAALCRGCTDRRQAGADRLPAGGRHREEARRRILCRLRGASGSRRANSNARRDAPAAASQPVSQPAPVVASATSSGLSPVLWIIGLVVIVAAILGFVALR